MSALERISYIDSTIHKVGGIVLQNVASRFEVSPRQVKRDIEYMRYRLNAPIEYARERARYEYREAYTGLSYADEKALLFYVFARAAAGTLAYVPIAAEDGLDALRGQVPRDLRHLADRIRYELPDFEPADEESLSVLIRSIADRRRFDASYRDSDGRETERRAVGLRLLNYAGVWYCVTWDIDKADYRIFRVARMRNVRLSDTRIDAIPDDEDVDAYLSRSYGVFKGSDATPARIRFYDWARSVVEREVWHADQERFEGVDPERGPWIELSVPASRFEELLGRVLRFGSQAEPVSPESFKNAWRLEIERMYRISRP